MGEHYYDIDGNPCHTVIGKTTGKPRPTTIRDAKELELLPSVTSYMGILDKPALNRAGQKRVARAMFDLLQEDYDMDNYEAIEREAFTQAFQGWEDAAKAGTIIHDAIETYYANPKDYNSGTLVTMPESGREMVVQEFVDPVNEWLLANKIEIVDCEIPIVNEGFGYAGLCDCVALYKGEKVVIDWKTTKTTEKMKASQMPWDSHPTQIAAYSKALFGSIPDHGINVYISTTELDPKPRVEAVIWDKDKLMEEWECFVQITKVWQARKGYTPPCTLT